MKKSTTTMHPPKALTRDDIERKAMQNAYQTYPKPPTILLFSKPKAAPILYLIVQHIDLLPKCAVEDSNALRTAFANFLCNQFGSSSFIVLQTSLYVVLSTA